MTTSAPGALARGLAYNRSALQFPSHESSNPQTQLNVPESTIVQWGCTNTRGITQAICLFKPTKNNRKKMLTRTACHTQYIKIRKLYTPFSRNNSVFETEVRAVVVFIFLRCRRTQRLQQSSKAAHSPLKTTVPKMFTHSVKQHKLPVFFTRGQTLGPTKKEKKKLQKPHLTKRYIPTGSQKWHYTKEQKP